MDREAWWATVHGAARVRHDLVTKQQQQQCILGYILWAYCEQCPRATRVRSLNMARDGQDTEKLWPATADGCYHLIGNHYYCYELLWKDG